VILAMLVLSLVVLACSCSSLGQAPQVAATVKAVATEVKSAASISTPVATAKPGAAATVAPGGGDDKPLSLSDRQSGLDKLKSYRMKWQADWKSTEATSTQVVNWNWVEEYSSEPQALHWTWKMTDSTEKNKSLEMEMWQIEDTTYMLQKDGTDKGQCISFSSDDQKNQLTKGLFSPNALGSVKDAKYVDSPTVNGIKTKHYKYDEKGFALFGAAKVAGEIWVAVDGEFIVKETLTWSGAAGLFGVNAKEKGDGKWTWEITDANKDITIKAPENCGGASSDIPMMKDATEKNRFGDTTMYKSATKLADVVKFYQKEMIAAGWKASGEPQISDEFAQLEFTKGDQQAEIMLTADKGATQVIINVTK